MRFWKLVWVLMLTLLYPSVVFSDRYICSSAIPVGKLQHPEDTNNVVYVAQPVLLEFKDKQLHSIEWVEFSLYGGRTFGEKTRQSMICEKSFGTKKQKCWVDEMPSLHEKNPSLYNETSTPEDFIYNILQLNVSDPAREVDDLVEGIKAGKLILMSEHFIRMNFTRERLRHHQYTKRFAGLLCN